MIDIIQREFVYLWYYFDLQFRQIFWYWVLGMVLGSAITNLGALKIVLGMKHFTLYIAFVMMFSLVAGLAVNLIT